MTEKNGKIVALLFRILGTGLILISLYLIGDLKKDIRETRLNVDNHVGELQDDVTEIREDVNKIKGALGVE